LFLLSVIINNAEHVNNNEIQIVMKNIKENNTSRESIKNKNQKTTIKHIFY